MRIVSATDIINAHEIKSVIVKGGVVLVNNMFSFHYSNNKIAKAVASRVKMFVGVK